MKNTLSQSRVESWYGVLVKIFVLIAVVLVGVIIYVSFTKTVITVTAETVDKTITADTTVAELSGVVLLTDVEGSTDYPIATDAATTETAKPAAPAPKKETTTATEATKAKGTVVITNKYTKDQPLITNTRLLSKSGVLFRTQKTVTVPAGGEVTVDILADEAGNKGNLDATTFEVVALWSGLKDKIYATSSAATTGGADAGQTTTTASEETSTDTTTTATATATVTQNDIANAKKKLQAELFPTAAERFTKEMTEKDELKSLGYLVAEPILVKTSKDERTAEAGDSASTITVTQKMTVGSAALDQEKLKTFIKKQLEQNGASNVLSDDELLSATTITLSNLNETGTDGSLEIAITLKHTLDAKDSKLAPEKLTNKTPEEVQDYLLSFDEVKTVDVKLSPFWAARTPGLTSNITVTVTAAPSPTTNTNADATTDQTTNE